MNEKDEIEEIKSKSENLIAQEENNFLGEFQNTLIDLLRVYLMYTISSKTLDPEDLPKHIIDAMDEMLLRGGHDIYKLSNAKPLSLGHSYFVDYIKKVFVENEIIKVDGDD